MNSSLVLSLPYDWASTLLQSQVGPRSFPHCLLLGPLFMELCPLPLYPSYHSPPTSLSHKLPSSSGWRPEPGGALSRSSALWEGRGLLLSPVLLLAVGWTGG